MKQNVCTYADTRDERLVAYLYNETVPDEELAFEEHLAACALCRADLDALRGVRTELGQWAPPEPSFSVALPSSPSPIGAGPRQTPTVARWQMPAWAQAVAAVLVLGVAAGAANLDVSYSASQGLSVRTGWAHAPATAVVAPQTPPPVATPWRSDLAALEERLRNDMATHPVVSPVTTASDDAPLRRVRVLLQESEQRQQRDLALRFAEMAREVESQRQTDLVKIDRSLGLIQSRTGMEVMRTQQQVNSLAQRVSQRQ